MFFFVQTAVIVGGELEVLNSWRGVNDGINYSFYLRKSVESFVVMYNYHKLKVYGLAKEINVEMLKYITHSRVEFYIKNQLGRATLSVMLNIAEGSGRLTDPDKKRFYVISRSSLFEVSSVLELLKETLSITDEQYKWFDRKLQTLSRMLNSLIESLRS